MAVKPVPTALVENWRHLESYECDAALVRNATERTWTRAGTRYMVHCVLDTQVRGTVRAKYRYVVQCVPNTRCVVQEVPGTRYVVHFVADLVHLVRMVWNARYL